MSNSLNLEEIQKTDTQGYIVPWLSDDDHSPHGMRKRVTVFNARTKRCSVCGAAMKGTYVFSGKIDDFDLEGYFPRMAMHLGCCLKLNIKERYPIVAKNEHYFSALANGYKVGKWVEYWLFDEIKGKWQTIQGGHSKKFKEFLFSRME